MQGLDARTSKTSKDNDRSGQAILRSPGVQLDVALSRLKNDYGARNPESAALYEASCEFMPGGNTRSNLHVNPFPLTLASGDGATCRDADGHEYIDFIGNYSAALYGHGHPKLQAAMPHMSIQHQTLCGPSTHEHALSSVLCSRFPSIQSIRFCHSGTEANLMAIAAAKAFTGRSTILVFKRAYHGGVLAFGDEIKGSEPNLVPYKYVLADYNDVAGSRSLIVENAHDLAAILVEPMLGSGGCYLGSYEFLLMLREETHRVGAILVFDEVMTSRLSGGGIQLRYGITPDLTTLGKYIGAGMPLGAFGGKSDVMALFDPRLPSSIVHPGTFNINPLALRLGYIGLTEIYTPDVAEHHNMFGDNLRSRLNAMTRQTCMWFSGLGSLMNVHFCDKQAGTIRESLDNDSDVLKELLYFHLLEAGIYISKRGFITLSLAIGKDHKFEDALISAVQSFLDKYLSFIVVPRAS